MTVELVVGPIKYHVKHFCNYLRYTRFHIGLPKPLKDTIGTIICLKSFALNADRAAIALQSSYTARGSII